MNGLIAGLFLFCGILIGLSVARKVGFYSASSVYIWFFNVDLALFLLITFARLEKSNFSSFTAMPWSSSFESVLLPTLFIYGILILAGWLSSYKLHKVNIPNRLSAKKIISIPHVIIKNYSNLLFLFFLLILAIELYHFWDIDKSILWQNQIYLTINDPSLVGIDTLIGRMIHLLLRPMGLLLISAGTYFWLYHRHRTAILFFLLSFYPFLIALAQNSRWAPLFVVAVLATILIFGNIKKNFFAILVGGAFGFLIFVKVLVGRHTIYQGLSGIFDIFRIIFVDPNYYVWILGFFLNIFMGTQSIANTLLINPHYPVIYKLLSFAPTISAIDHFDKLQDLYMVKIAAYVPMSAYSEAFFFGAPYFLFLLIILIAWLRTITRLSLRKGVIGTAFTIFSYWGIFYVSQYTVRSSMRLIYLSLLIGIIVDKVLSKKAKTRARKIAQKNLLKEAEGEI